MVLLHSFLIEDREAVERISDEFRRQFRDQGIVVLRECDTRKIPHGLQMRHWERTGRRIQQLPRLAFLFLIRK